MNQITIDIFNKTGSFAENKDVARDIRLEEIIPALREHKKVILNFENVNGATQSFIHALISDALRIHGLDSLDYIIFKSCNDTIKAIIKIVVEYMQEGMME